MPAYRSSAEAEIRDAAVARIRQHRPGARIIHEINASDFGNRIDVLAVCEAEIIAVEVKSAKDKIDRLPAQIAAMKGAAHHVIAALHEKVPRRPFLAVPRRATMPTMIQSLRWSCTGAEITRGICAALRRRECVEADPPISEEGRAA